MTPVREDAGTAGNRPDLRAPVLGAAAWCGALLGLRAGGRPAGWWLLAAACLIGLVLLQRRRMAGILFIVAAGVAVITSVRVAAIESSPVARWAQQRAVATAELVLRGDPVVRQGRFGDYVVVRARTTTVTVRGATTAVRVPVLLIGGEGWSRLALGSKVAYTGRLAPADGGDVAAVLTGHGDPRLLDAPARPLRWADGVRASVRRAAAQGPDQATRLVPALVTGDDGALPDRLVQDFRTAGLTHLTAVSGTNLTLLLAALLLVARWCGVRARGTPVVGLLGVVGFVLLARPEPSVIRAAAMGSVALAGMGAGGRASGVRALGVAALLLLVFDPWLSVSPGFALSVLATAGILLVGPGFRDALARWLPRPAAEAVAVPLAAQLACTPVVAALSGQVSVVAVAANLLAAPAVGPATVLGLLAGLIGLVIPPLGVAFGWVACWCAQWLVVVGHRAAGIPGAAFDWPTGGLGLTVLTVLSLGALLGGHRLLRDRRPVFGATVLVLALPVLRVLMPHAGWPPDGWVLVMCDVGQGDALVLATGAHEAVVIDAGPDPVLVDGCLRRLGVTRVPAVVLTHFHADHVDGLPGVLSGRRVGEVEVSSLREPAYGAEQVDRQASAAGTPVRVATYGEQAQVGDVTWRVLAPRRLLSDSPNDASLVLLVESHGLRLLLTGDVEPPSQSALLREELGPIDVLKVPHHGSRYQDDRLLTSLGARVALVSVGEGNDYGHPDVGTLALLQQAGALVRRTDSDGDLAVVTDGPGALRVVSRRCPSAGC